VSNETDYEKGERLFESQKIRKKEKALTHNHIRLLAITTIGIMFLAVAPAGAQLGPGPERTDKQLAMLKERLNLTDKQAEQIKGIMEESRKQALAERGKHKGDPESASKFREEHRKATDEKIMAVLNGDQKKEYAKIKDEMRRNRQDMKERRGRGDGPEKGGPRGDGRGR
jgi:Spy/CpxP family protein refolding chaperone